MFCAQCGQWVGEGDDACRRCGAALHSTALGPLPAIAAAVAVASLPATAPPAAPPVRFAGFWRRFATVLVDGLVLFFPNAIIRLLLGGDAFGLGGDLGTAEARSGLAAMVVMRWLYCAALESSAAQGTLGQQLLGLRVCDERLRRVSFMRASGRFVAQLLSIVTCGVGYLVNLWTRRRQTLHDLVAGCVIARAETLPASGGTP